MTGLRWSRRTTTTIADELGKLGIAVSPNTVARLLHPMGYSLRVNQKQISTRSSPNRNLQFEYLAERRDRFQHCHLPIVSVDSKKRELVGNFKNPGHRWESAPRCVYDHDFRTDSIGVAIPYGIYDVMENRGALVVGVSHDTSAFAAHAIAHWWHQEGSTRYRGSRQLLILADTGGSNSCRCHAWKTEIQSQLANSFALAVTVAHYPTAASKWNPIEYRLFSEVSRNWAGEPLDSYPKTLNYARTTQTQTGLQVTAYLDHRYYPCGLKPTPDQIASGARHRSRYLCSFFFAPIVLAYIDVRIVRAILERNPMLESLADLEQQRRALFQRMMELPDFRSGSITATYGTCGKPNCHCHQPNQPPHGPNFRLTRKVKGKTVTESFATPAELQKAQREVATFQQFRELSQELIALNEKICRARPVADRELPPSKKKRRKHFSRKSAEK